MPSHQPSRVCASQGIWRCGMDLSTHNNRLEYSRQPALCQYGLAAQRQSAWTSPFGSVRTGGSWGSLSAPICHNIVTTQGLARIGEGENKVARTMVQSDSA